MKTGADPKNIVPFMTRLPRALHGRLATYAAQDHRSLNQQIIAMLEEAERERRPSARRPPSDKA